MLAAGHNYHTLEEQANYLRIINELAIEMLNLDSMDDVLWTIAKTAIANLGLDDCVIYLIDQTGEKLVQRAAHGPKNPEGMHIKNPIVIPMGQGIVGNVAATGKQSLVSDTRKDPRYIVDDQSRLSEIAVPIIYRDRAIGVIDSEHEQANYYTQSHMDILLTIASMASTKIASMLLIEELRAKEKELTFIARHDPLTQLKNRRDLLERLDRFLQSTKLSNEVATIWFIDLDRFKLYNDQHGHIAGDEMLRQVAGLIGLFTSEHHFAARLGGDEFVIVFEGVGAKETLPTCRQFIRNVQSAVPVGVSIGITEMDRNSISNLAVLEVGSLACHQAKKSGGDRFYLVCSDDDRYQFYSGQLSWAAEIEKALERETLMLCAQPIVDLKRARGAPVLSRYEILVRLVKEDKSIIEARDFLAAGEQFGLMSKVDLWVIKAVLKWLTDEGRAPDIDKVHVNVSGSSVSDETFTNLFVQEVVDSKVGGRICVEITETSAISNLIQAKAFVQKLKTLGVSTAIDDFGTGFSSFLLLRDLECDVVKIDGAFVDSIHTDVNEKIIRSITEVANSLGAVTVAEGIEDRRALEMVCQSGVEYGQGYYVGRPVSLDKISAEQRTLTLDSVLEFDGRAETDNRVSYLKH